MPKLGLCPKCLGLNGAHFLTCPTLKVPTSKPKDGDKKGDKK